jgi:formylglycine-generating enzyme required for sulfatase activity
MSRPSLRFALALALAAGLALPLLPAQAPAGKKYAVLVGVKTYEHSKLGELPYAENDVTELAELLGKHGYHVTLLRSGAEDKNLRPTLANINARLAEVLEKCKRDDLVLVALVGHGLQFEKDAKGDPGGAYFCPQDARPLRQRRETLLSLGKLYRELDESGAGVKLLLVDACRDDPSIPQAVRRGVNGTSSPRPPSGVAALFSCSAGESAWESPRLRHGVFFHYVLEGLRGKAAVEGEVTWDGLQQYVRRQVARNAGRLIGGDVRQTPALSAGELAGEPPVLIGPEVDRAAAEKPPLAKAPFSAAKAKELQRAWAKYLGRKVEEELDLGGGVKMQFVLIPPGTFTMGSSKAEVDQVLEEDKTAKREYFADEAQHEVTITKPFYLAKYAVTRGQFRRFVSDAEYQTEAETDGLGGWGYDEASNKFKGPTWDPKTGEYKGGTKTSYTWKDPGFRQSKEHPVVNVNWNDARAFCRWLAKRSGRKARLPSEAQWEYACRAGTTTRYFFGDDLEGLAEYANVADGTAKKKFPGWTWAIKAEDGYVFTAPVGSYRPNPLGLYDMHGNVWQWCQDWYEPDLTDLDSRDPVRVNKGSHNARVPRGGSWFGSAGNCRAATRGGVAPAFRYCDVGFRVAFRLD